MSMDEWVKQMEEWFGKLPDLPGNVREWIVKLAPWFALVFGALGVLGSLAATGILAALSPFIALGGGLGAAAGGIVGALAGLISSGLMLAAFPGLRARKTAGWKYAFWSEAVNVTGALLVLNLAGAAVSALVGFYLLFQVKSYYK
jgi:hypothetical protein